MDWDCPHCTREFEAYHSYSTHFRHKHDGNALADAVGHDRLAELYAEMSANALSDHFGVSRPVIKRALESVDNIERRGPSEASQLRSDQMTSEELKEQTRKAREEQFEKYGDGGYLSVWIEENPEAHREHAQQVAHLGTPARESNGMAGVTGQDHPHWRGGKSVYDAVKKLLGDESWATTRARICDQADGECEMCGRSAEEIEYRDLDVHHIVPLLCGGTNEDWNLMALCNTCHHRTEWRTREVLDPVVVG